MRDQSRHAVLSGPAVLAGPALNGHGTPTGEVLVASELHRGPHILHSPAARLVAGALSRRGVQARCGPLRVQGTAGPGAIAVGWGAEPQLTAGEPFLVLATVGPPPDRAGRVLIDEVTALWRRSLRPRTVLLAAPRSFCAGVERAVETVEQLLADHGRPVYVRKQIVHNSHVVRGLEQRGAVFVDELDQVPDGALVVFSAHGVSPAVREEAVRRGLRAVDATCPLVTKVHHEARRFARRGDTVVLIGHVGHEEVEGTVGQAPAHTVVVATAAEAAALEVADEQHVSYLTQTTLAVEETAEVIGALQARFPALRGPRSEDICYATTNRQAAVQAVAGEADVVLVAGSANSSNSVRMVEVARRRGVEAHLVDRVDDIDLGWLAEAATVGLSAGASAPPHLVDEAIGALAGLGPVTVRERVTQVENVRFAPARKVRSS